MSSTEHGLGRKVLDNTAFALLDTLLTKLGTTLAFVLLVRLLTSDDIAAVGIASGYLALLAFLDFAPIRVLIRDFASVAADRRERDRLLTALFAFWFLQAAAMLVACGALHLFVFPGLELPGLSFLFLGLTVDFIYLTFQDWLKVVFYADFKQSVATGLSFTLSLVRTTAYVLLLLSASLETYAWILIATSLAGCVAWGWLFIKHFGYRPVLCRRTPRLLLQSLQSYGLWDHSNSIVIDTLFTCDTVMLSWFALDAGLEEIGNYTIALRFTSLLFLVPRQLQNGLQLTLSNYRDERKRRDAIQSFLKAGAAISLVQLVAVAVAGRWMLELLFGDVAPSVFTYVSILAVAVSIMNLAYPAIGVLSNLCSLRHVFLTVFLPPLLIGLAIYAVTASRWGPIGVAYGNIAVYAVLASSIAIYTARYCPVPLALRLLTEAERRFLAGFLRRR